MAPQQPVAKDRRWPLGTVQGKAALRAYVKKGFEVFDHIKFTVLDVLRGVDSIAIHYKGITGTHVVEVLFFDKDDVVRERTCTRRRLISDRFPDSSVS